MHVASPPGDGLRVMVVERAGVVRVVRGGVTLPTPFLDLSSEVDVSGEGGLSAVAFAPDYVTSRRFYVFLVPKDANPGAPPWGPIQVREYLRSAADPERADRASGRVVLTVPHPDNSNHYGGDLRFGPDGMLYVSTGDGGGTGDPGDNALDVTSRLGKLLRLDPRPGAVAPADNPFAGATPGDELVWSFGLRNPFRFSFDRATGDLTIADVGQNFSEEIDYVSSSADRGKGADFGWDDCEGPFDYPIGAPALPCSRSGDTPPVHAYEPVSGCRAITGGVVVRDPGLEELAGRYVYGDFCQANGRMRSIQLDAADPPATDAPLGVSAPGVVALSEDACGRVHVVQLTTGAVSRLEDESPQPCNARVTYPQSFAGGGAGPLAVALPPLRITLGGPRRQRALRRRYVLVRVACSGPCRVRALGRILLSGGYVSRPLVESRRRLAAAGRTTLRLRIPRAVRIRSRRALRGGRRVRARLRIRVRDSAGRLTVRTRTVRIIG